MGEYAEMMLDGTCCEACGCYLDREPQGFPGYCSKECAADRGVQLQDFVPQSRTRRNKKPLTDAQRARRKRKNKAKNAKRKAKALAAVAAAQVPL
jgi:hypothetical protein